MFVSYLNEGICLHEYTRCTLVREHPVYGLTPLCDRGLGRGGGGGGDGLSSGRYGRPWLGGGGHVFRYPGLSCCVVVL